MLPVCSAYLTGDVLSRHDAALSARHHVNARARIPINLSIRSNSVIRVVSRSKRRLRDLYSCVCQQNTAQYLILVVYHDKPLFANKLTTHAKGIAIKVESVQNQPSKLFIAVSVTSKKALDSAIAEVSSYPQII